MKAGYCESESPATLLSTSGAACCLGVHSSTVRRWQKKGLFRSYTGGIRRNLGFRQSDILNFFVLNAFDKCKKTPLSNGLDKAAIKTTQ